MNQPPIIPPFPQLPPDLIQFKVLALANGVAVHHDVGIVTTSIKELFTIGEGGTLHPDLVSAAVTSIQSMAAKYNGVSTDETSKITEASNGQTNQRSDAEANKEGQVGA